MDAMKYYRFEKGGVLVRKCGERVEKKGADGVWRDAPELLWRFQSGDLSLEEVAPEELSGERRAEPGANA